MMYEADGPNDLDQLRSRYDVLRVLGHDGPFLVYAVRIRGTHRHFAVKVIDHSDARSANSGALHAWQAHTVERLEHPKILGLHAVHHLQGGAVAIAMERRRGRTVAEYLEDSGPLPISRITAILRDTAEALAYLHGRGIVHRSVSPHSIFIDRDSRHARLAIFGIEKRDESAIANPAANVATLAYAAPEQLDGDAIVDGRSVGPRSDLFSLGLAAYAMLMGSLPWEGAFPQDVVARRSQPVPLTASLRADTPPALREAIQRCVEPNPRRRWKSAEELLTFLDSAPDAEPAQEVVPDEAGLRTRATNGALAMRAAIGQRLAAVTRGRFALVAPGAAIGLLALGLLQGTEEPARPAHDALSDSSAPVLEEPLSETRPDRRPIHPRAQSIPPVWEVPQGTPGDTPGNPTGGTTGDSALSGSSPSIDQLADSAIHPADDSSGGSTQPRPAGRDVSPVFRAGPPQADPSPSRTARSSGARRPRPNSDDVPPASVDVPPSAVPQTRPRDSEPAIPVPGQRFVGSPSSAVIGVTLLGEPIVRPSTFSLLGDPVLAAPRR